MKPRARTLRVSAPDPATRRDHLRNALGNAALEGIKPPPQAIADLQAVAGGTLTAEQYRQRVKARYGIQG
jgi:hypothetical protein